MNDDAATDDYDDDDCASDNEIDLHDYQPRRLPSGAVRMAYFIVTDVSNDVQHFVVDSIHTTLLL